MQVKYFIILLFVTSSFVHAQYKENRFSIGINGVYTTTAEIYLNPNSSDPILRNNAFEISDIFNPAIDFRYRLTDQIIIGLGTEYMKATANGPNLTAFVGNSTVTINVTDGFLLIPVELSGYYILPFSTEKFKFLMGGGVGYYYGKQVREFGDAAVRAISRNFAYGIQVSVSMDYMILDNLSVHSAMKFRDPQFKVENAYNELEVNYNNQKIILAQRTFSSKIDVNGVTFILGFSFLF
jgi:outer membrane protein W